MKRIKFNNGKYFSPINDKISDLLEKPNIIVQFDTAPDGIARFTEIKRTQFNREQLKDLINPEPEEKKGSKEELDSLLGQIEFLLDQWSLKQGIIMLNTKDLKGMFYLFPKPLQIFTCETLLTQIIGPDSKLNLLQQKDSFYTGKSTRRKTSTAAVKIIGEEEFKKVSLELEKEKFPAISFEDNNLYVLGLQERANYSEFQSVDKYREETISIFEPKVVIREYNDHIIEEHDFCQNHYLSHLSKVVNNPSLNLSFKISSLKLAKSLIEITKYLSELHKDGVIHCDIKPQNILSLHDGLHLIDSLGVRNGGISPGLTENFCAPEQILSLPVSPSTDIYNIGLLVLSIIDGVIYGKTSRYVIPTGKMEVKNINLLTEPEIYLDFQESPIQSAEGRKQWQLFLKKCLAFQPQNRFTTIDNFLTHFQKLLKLYPLQKYIEFRPYFGKLSFVEDGDKIEPAWFI